MTPQQPAGFPEYGIPTAIEALAAERQGRLLDEAGRRRLVGPARRREAVPRWQCALGHALVRLGQRLVGAGPEAGALARGGRGTVRACAS